MRTSDENERRRCRKVKIVKCVVEVQDGRHLIVQRCRSRNGAARVEKCAVIQKRAVEERDGIKEVGKLYGNFFFVWNR